MSDVQMIPLRRVRELLAEIAERDFGFRVQMYTGALILMCKLCHPDQPERLERLDGRGHAPWQQVLHRDHSLVRFLIPEHGMVPVADACEAITIEPCREHDVDNALGGWYWCSELETAIAHAIASESDEWAEEWAERERSALATKARQEAINAAYALGQRITPEQRVQAVAAVLKAAGITPTVEQAKLSWKCGHVSFEGTWERLSIVVNSDGIPDRGPDWCGQHPSEDVVPDFLTVGDEYRLVAEMTPEERAKYKPVPETTRKANGWPPRRGGGSSTKAEPKAQWTVESTRAWSDDHGIDASLPVQRLWAKVKTAGVTPHPPRAAIEAMKRATRAE